MFTLTQEETACIQRTNAGVDSKGVRLVRVDVTLDLAKFTGPRALARDSRFNGLVCAAGGGSDSSLGWLAGTWTQQWPIVNEVRSQNCPGIIWKRDPEALGGPDFGLA